MLLDFEAPNYVTDTDGVVVVKHNLGRLPVGASVRSGVQSTPALDWLAGFSPWSFTDQHVFVRVTRRDTWEPLAHQPVSFRLDVW